ncbi:MAG: tetratricopeptide repeat-containing protein kinase family protein [Acidobacteriota bacterium]
MLYRLLSGRPPYVLPAGASVAELRASLRGPVPVSAAAAAAGQPWAGRLPGDLDAIVAAAMAFERADRYSSVRELASDLRRHLAHRQVSVREPRAGYRLGLFLRRNRLAVGAAVIVVVALSSGLVATSWALHRARQAQSTAEAHLADLTREQQRSGQLIESFVSTFRLADPGQAQGETITVRELIDRSTSTLGSSEVDPELAAYLAATFGQVYLNVGSPARAESLLRRSLEGAIAELPGEHLIPWQTRSLLAESLSDQGDFQSAAEQLVRDIRHYRRDVGHEGLGLARLVHGLGVTKLHAEEHAAAASLFRQALRLFAAAGADALLEIAESRHRLAQALMKSGDLATSEQILRSVLESRRLRLGPSHPASLTALGDLAAVALFRDDNASAARLFTQVLEGQRAIFGPDHPHVAVALQNLAVAERRLGHRDSARANLTESVAVRRRIHGGSHPAVADALYGLARFHHQGGELDDAEPLYTEALEIRRRELGDSHPHVTMTLLGIADLAWSRAELGRAEPLYREVIRRLEASGRAETFDATFAYLQLGSLLLRAEEPEATRWLERAYRLRRQQLGEAHSATTAARLRLSESRLRFPAKAVEEAVAGRNDPAPPLPS